ncbi:MAG: efflux RND transporter periplasmic adaptor subunit [Deltaproteobacteria bacterium]|nr:efflux RND transporter periplasmic adaptor subunit [Deltaproteobacteria bacterium]
MKYPIRNISLKNRGLVMVGVVILAFVLGYAFRNVTSGVQAKQDNRPLSETTAEETPGVRTVYVCSMSCLPPANEPGNCPVCGMKLIPMLLGDKEEQDKAKLVLGEEAIRRAEVRIQPVERKFVSAEVRMFGQIEYDPAHMSYVSAFMPGVIDRVYVKRAGQTVRWHDRLFDLYSSDLYFTQQELVSVMKTIPSFLAFQAKTPYTARKALTQSRSTGEGAKADSPEYKEAMDKLAAIRHKLHILGLPKADIDELMKLGEPTGIAGVYATKAGVVIEQNAYEGAFVNTGTPIFTIGDPRYVWARLDAYESDFPWLHREQKVEFETDAYPGVTFTGKIVFIDPTFDPNKRTFKIGALYPDEERKLRPNMLVRAKAYAELTADGKVRTDFTGDDEAPLVIPASAPLITGERAIVYVAVPGENITFEGREVVLGCKAKDYYLVREGLEEGELVVVNGNFKLDSAMQILAKPSMMNSHRADAESDPRP